jgi:[ribosomal protein S5]-alanine N-acetyltransferase
MIFHESKRLIFRSHEPQDEGDFVAMHTDAEVRRYVGGSAWSQERAIQRFRESYVGKPDDVFGLWATILKENGRFIGSCGLANPPNSDAPHLGYYVARPYWGQGLASEAAEAFLEIGFVRLGLPRIFGDVEKGHLASERILQKISFQLLSEEKVPTGRVISTYELSHTRWKQRKIEL